MDLGQLLRNRTIPLRHPPTFKSNNIECAYGLEILVIAACGGNDFELKFEVGAITVLAAEYVGEKRARDQAILEATWASKHPEIPEINVDDNFI